MEGNYDITCPYCFRTMKDFQVMFRSEKYNLGESDIIPEDYDDFDDFMARYHGEDKEDIILRYKDWDFFAPKPDDVYEEFWRRFRGTTEVNPADDVFGIKSYHRRVIDPSNPEHQRYIKKQADSSYFITDAEGMVTQIELYSGERCNRRVCRHCHNPLPDNYGKSVVKFVTIIGITGAGKTVYLSQLLRKMKDYSTKVGLAAITATPSVQQFLVNNTVAANKPLPGSTAAESFQQPLFYEMIREVDEHRRATETLVMYDVAGEVFAKPDLLPSFAPFIEHADGIVVLIDPHQFEEVQNASIDGQALDEPTKAMDAIHSIMTHGNSNEKCTRPVAVCISKVDTPDIQNVLSSELKSLLLQEVQGIKGPNGFYETKFDEKSYRELGNRLMDFFQNNAMSLATTMHANYETYDYFAFTALGCDVRSDGPVQYPVGPVLPKRIEEAILWMFYQLGYIDTNIEKIHCPECGSVEIYEVPENERTITSGFGPFKKTKYVTHGCTKCDHRWELI